MVRTRIFLTAATVALMAGEASALSCLRPEVTRAFADADASEERYVVVLGTLTFDQSALPTDTMTGEETQVPARFEGMSLTEDGFTVPTARDVTLLASCAGPWCGTATAGQEILAFMSADDGYVIEVDACFSQVFAEPTPEQIDTVTGCMADGC